MTLATKTAWLEHILFYNRDEPFPAEKILKLSNACLENINTSMLELLVQVLIMIFSDSVREHGSEAANMLFTQFNMEDAQKVWYREGVEDGEAKGEARGEFLKLIDFVCRKLKKGKTPEMIADELEEPLETVELICTAATTNPGRIRFPAGIFRLYSVTISEQIHRSPVRRQIQRDGKFLVIAGNFLRIYLGGKLVAPAAEPLLVAV